MLTIPDYIKVDLVHNLNITEQVDDVIKIEQLTDNEVKDWFGTAVWERLSPLAHSIIEIITKHKHISD